jgi:L-aspartate oxidase
MLSAGDDAIQFLKTHGVQFDQVNGESALRLEGGHAVPRVYHYEDRTGYEIIRALTTAVQRLSNVTLLEYHTAINLITLAPSHQPQSQSEVIGAYILEEKTGIIHTLIADQVVLATGGAGKVYRYTSNPDIATGDGIAMAYRAGARVGNMEFIQFHPTLLYHDQQKNFLVSEVLRGEGGLLRLPKTEARFMHKYAPKALELATRDIVARAIFNEIEASGYDYVYLDMRHQERQSLQRRFPTIYQTLAELGIAMERDLIPVVPAAHYLCGGVLTDAKGQTDLPRLYAIGETAFSGLHGANRLASNSLLEGVVMGQLAAASIATGLSHPLPNVDHVPDWNSTGVVDVRRASQISAHWRGLRGEMMSYAGIIRTEAGLKDLLRLITTRAEMIEEYYWHYAVSRDLIELRNIILIAELIVRSALNRRESRGGHYRADYPDTHPIASESLLRSSDLIMRVT